MKKLLLILTIGSLFNSCKDEAEEDIQIQSKAVLEEMVTLAEDHSINRLTTDWEVARENVNQAYTDNGFEEAVRVLLRIMDTNHSFYRSDSLFIYESVLSCSPSNYTFSDFSPLIGYVDVNSFSGSTDEAVVFADNIQRTIAQGTDDGKDRWVVDLSGNGGGNMYPMVAGIGPLVGNDILGYFIDPDGSETVWGYQSGFSYIGGTNNPVTTVTDPGEILDASTKVAVIIDNVTASSGEAAAISFIGRPNTRFFGTASCGLSTANITYPLSNDALFILTVSTMADREKTTYGGQIQPDETFENSADLQARIEEWLLEE